jgi:SAM-dependent methyltransferase
VDAGTRDGTEDGRVRAIADTGNSSRRVRSQAPRERSGPIGITGGDFATPLVRKRTTTQPRGLPVVGAVPTEEPAASRPNGSSPPPPPPVASARADEVPFTPGPAKRVEADDEAAALAAEAAAVRALDSGPITPPPELESDPGPTPPPEAAAAPAAALREELSGPLTPAPAVLVSNGAAAPPAAEEPPELPAEALDSAPAPAGPPAAADDSAGAIPTHAMGADGVGQLDDDERSPEPRVAPPPADEPAASSTAAEDGGEVAGDDLEVMEGGEPAPDAPSASATAAPVSSAVATSAGSPAPPPLRVATPPPLRLSAAPPPPPAALQKAPPSSAAAAGDPATAGSATPLMPALPILPEALTQRPRRPKRSKPWFEEVFDEDYLRALPFMNAEQTLREVEFIEHSLQVPTGAEVLDIACGYGRHAIELVQRGLKVTGLDLSLPLLIRAADEAQRRSLSVNFVHADMREMAFDRQFDGAYCMLTSFGYFDEETNLRVAEGIARALKPGAHLLLDVVNRDYVVADLPSRVWWEGSGCVVLEEVDFNFHTSRIVTHRSIVFDDGRQLEQEISIRAYSLHELGRLLRQAGFRVLDVSGSLGTRGHYFGSTSRNLLVVAERRTDET